MNIFSLKSNWLHRLTAIMFGLLGIAGSVQAGTNTKTFYYSATASVSTINGNGTAGGKVYVSATSTNSPAYQNRDMTITGSGTGLTIWGADIGPEKSFYFYATPNEGFTFSGWKKDGTGNYVSTSKKYTSPNFEITGSNSDRTKINYTAYFTN